MGTLVFSDKLTKFHHEFEKVIKNRSKIFYGLSVVFSRMSSDIFFLPKVLWEYHSIQFLYSDFFFSYSAEFSQVSKLKFALVRWKTFLSDSVETREFLWVKTPMGIQWFEGQFRAIFSFLRESIQSWSKLAKNELSSSLVVSNISDWSKSLMGTIFLRVDLLPSG